MTASPAEIVAALAAAGPVRERVLTQLVESLVLEDAVVVSGDGGPGRPAGRSRCGSCGRRRSGGCG